MQKLLKAFLHGTLCFSAQIVGESVAQQLV